MRNKFIKILQFIVVIVLCVLLKVSFCEAKGKTSIEPLPIAGYKFDKKIGVSFGKPIDGYYKKHILKYIGERLPRAEVFLAHEKKYDILCSINFNILKNSIKGKMKLGKSEIIIDEYVTQKPKEKRELKELLVEELNKKIDELLIYYFEIDKKLIEITEQKGPIVHKKEKEIEKKEFNLNVMPQLWYCTWKPETKGENIYRPIVYEIDPALLKGVDVGIRYGKVSFIGSILSSLTEEKVTTEAGLTKTEKGELHRIQGKILKKYGKYNWFQTGFVSGNFKGVAEGQDWFREGGKLYYTTKKMLINSDWFTGDILLIGPNLISRFGDITWYQGYGLRYWRYNIPNTIFNIEEGTGDVLWAETLDTTYEGYYGILKLMDSTLAERENGWMWLDGDVSLFLGYAKAKNQIINKGGIGYAIEVDLGPSYTYGLLTIRVYYRFYYNIVRIGSGGSTYTDSTTGKEVISGGERLDTVDNFQGPLVSIIFRF